MSQKLPLVEQLKSLERLQELDLRIDSIKKNQSSLPVALRSVQESVNQHKSQLTAKTAQMTEVEKVLRQSQAALDLNQDRLARANSKLESVQNSQEYQAATKEIDQLKKLQTSLEEQGKTARADLELAQKAKEELEQKLIQLEQEYDAQKEVVSGQESQFKQDVEGLVGERREFTDKVEARYLAQYDRIRAARGGLGIVPAVGGRCKGCNMVLPPQLFNEVQRGNQVHSCPCCHRLLYIS